MGVSAYGDSSIYAGVCIGFLNMRSGWGYRFCVLLLIKTEQCIILYAVSNEYEMLKIYYYPTKHNL